MWRLLSDVLVNFHWIKSVSATHIRFTADQCQTIWWRVKGSRSTAGDDPRCINITSGVTKLRGRILRFPPCILADRVVFWFPQTDGLQESLGAEKKVRGRTGWPQQVWALELNQWHPPPPFSLSLFKTLDSNQTKLQKPLTERERTAVQWSATREN